MRLLTILARYGVAQYSDAERRLQTILAQRLPGVDRDLIIVDNALGADPPRDADTPAVIAGDNRHREFTAFDRAVRFVGAGLAAYDAIHFVTSAFDTLYTAYMDRLSEPALEAAMDRQACLGHIDCYNEPVRLGPYLSQHWVRSCFFFLPPAQVQALGSFVSVDDAATYFSGDAADPFRPDAPVSAVYRRYIVDWLTGGDIGQGVTWHSANALTPERLAAFETKTLCIFNEQMLGVRLRAQGCPLVDLTWLATRLDAGASVAWTTPWREQLAGRDQAAVVPAG
jgi:hypothetical protein